MARLIVPAVLVLVTVAAFIGAAGWNRSGEPELVLLLTERELPLVRVNLAPGDNPGARLRIAYEARHDPLDARNWLPEARLREIGFAFNVPVTSPQAADAYDRVPPRVAWVVFEYDGPEWRAIAQRRAIAGPGALAESPMASRLVPVDAGLDFDLLLTRYPTGHLIVRGVIGLAYVAPARGGPMLHGVLRDVVPPTVSVPYPFRDTVGGLAATTERGLLEPRYEVEVAVGALGLPYIRSLRSPAMPLSAVGGQLETLKSYTLPIAR
jgi:hypothetical protein